MSNMYEDILNKALDSLNSLSSKEFEAELNSVGFLKATIFFDYSHINSGEFQREIKGAISRIITSNSVHLMTYHENHFMEPVTPRDILSNDYPKMKEYDDLDISWDGKFTLNSNCNDLYELAS